jgi:hypothetical protein
MDRELHEFDNNILSENGDALDQEKLVLHQNRINQHKDSVSSKKSQLQEKKYEINTTEESLIKLDPHFMTNDMDLKNLVDIINDPDENWELILHDKICKIQRKMNKDNPTPIARTFATIEGYTSREIFDAIAIVSNRMEWDKNFLEFVSVEQNLNEGWEVFYMSLKVTR